MKYIYTLLFALLFFTPPCHAESVDLSLGYSCINKTVALGGKTLDNEIVLETLKRRIEKVKKHLKVAKSSEAKGIRVRLDNLILLKGLIKDCAAGRFEPELNEKLKATLGNYSGFFNGRIKHSEFVVNGSIAAAGSFTGNSFRLDLVLDGSYPQLFGTNSIRFSTEQFTYFPVTFLTEESPFINSKLVIESNGVVSMEGNFPPGGVFGTFRFSGQLSSDCTSMVGFFVIKGSGGVLEMNGNVLLRQ